jgi:predicted phage-related endonuclease
MKHDTVMPWVPVSWGELLDKAAILAIKQQRMKDPAARANVDRELALLRVEIAKIEPLGAEAKHLIEALRDVNEALWEIEDEIRLKEAAQSFDAEFIALARSVYHRNDERGRVKRELNRLLGSTLTEEKQYAVYPARRSG